MIPSDKLMHLAMGVLAILCAYIVLLTVKHIGPGAGAAMATTLFGVGYEVQQWYRKQGEPDPLDAFATALPGWLLWLGLALWG